jgi:2-polyprenyl-6-methoxyphenol hydroxylase-like FAD-dependent oxidoreductase
MESLNILIVGPGVAGLTYAGLLREQGAKFKIIGKESHDDFNGSGYMLGLLPFGGRVLTALDLEKEYLDQSIKMTDYNKGEENVRDIWNKLVR